MDLLVFSLGAHDYGVPVPVVNEVVRAVAPTPLPGAPAIVEGAIDYRGTVVPVLDLRSRFGHAAKPIEPSDHFIIARAAGRLVALRVDRAGWPAHVDPAALADLSGPVGAGPYVAGVCRLPDGLVVIHDLETFLSAAESAELTGALAADHARST
jgi:purine-binding chemotaxis protein CheW